MPVTDMDTAMVTLTGTDTVTATGMDTALTAATGMADAGGVTASAHAGAWSRAATSGFVARNYSGCNRWGVGFGRRLSFVLCVFAPHTNSLEIHPNFWNR